MRNKVQTQQFVTLCCLITAHSWYPDRTGRRSPAATSGRGRSCLIKPNEGANSDNSCSFFGKVFLLLPYLCIIKVSHFSTDACYRREGIYSPVCHIEENTWDFPQIEDDTGRQSAGRSYQKIHNLYLWWNCKRKHPRVF